MPQANFPNHNLNKFYLFESFLLYFGRKINFFTHLLNHLEGNLKVQGLLKIGYYIVPNPSTTLKKGRPEPEMWSMLYIMLVLLMDKFVELRQWTNQNCTIMQKNFRLVWFIFNIDLVKRSLPLFSHFCYWFACRMWKKADDCVWLSVADKFIFL